MATPPGPPLPLILDDASLKISVDDTTAALVELRCVTSHLELAPDTAITTVTTFCGSTDYPGVTKWALIATLFQSLDPQATEDTLSAALAFGGPVAFAIQPYSSKPAGPTNPIWHGLCVPRPHPPINGDAGGASTIDLDWSVIGTPTKATAALPLAAKAA